jgi:Ni/Co efflux regulator RcnB
MMKSFVIALALTITALAQAADYHAAADAAKAEHPTKRVCVDQMKDGKPVKDAKGNVKQTCKDVKEHKKLEVTK